MKFLTDLEQGTPRWHEWRAATGAYRLPDGGPRIMASELPAIAGDSPYQTPHQLWMLKTGRAQKAPPNAAMARGTLHEPRARSLVEERLGLRFTPVCVQAQSVFSTCPIWAGASLDGLSDDLSTVLEVKVPGRRVIQDVAQGRMPPEYRAQVQWQLMVSEAKKAVFAVYDPGDGLVSDCEQLFLIEEFPDESYQNRLVDAASAFRIAVMTDTPLVGDVAARAAARWLAAYEAKERAQKALDEAQVALLDLAPPGARVDMPGVTISRSMRAGAVDKDALILKIAREFGVDPGRINSEMESLRSEAKEVVSIRRSTSYKGFLEEYERSLRQEAATPPSRHEEDSPIGGATLAW